MPSVKINGNSFKIFRESLLHELFPVLDFPCIFYNQSSEVKVLSPVIRQYFLLIVMRSKV